MKKELILGTMFAVSLAVSGTALACGKPACTKPVPVDPCAMGHCSATSASGSMHAWISGHSMAYGDATFAGSTGSYQLTQKLPDGDFFQLQGVFMGASEGPGYSEAGGFSFGEAAWSKDSVIMW